MLFPLSFSLFGRQTSQNKAQYFLPWLLPREMLKRGSPVRCGIYFTRQKILEAVHELILGIYYLRARREQGSTFEHYQDLQGSSNGLLLNANYQRVVLGDCKNCCFVVNQSPALLRWTADLDQSSKGIQIRMTDSQAWWRCKKKVPIVVNSRCLCMHLRR